MMYPVDEFTMPITKKALYERARHLASLSVSLWLMGCATVPPEAVTLSEVVSGRVTSIQQSHEAFVRGYFDQSRDRLEDFLMDRWIPNFLDQFTTNANGNGESLLQVLDTVTPFDQEEVERLMAALAQRGVNDPAQALAAAEDALGGGEQGAVVLEFAQAAVDQIERKRRSLLDPIDDLEQRTLQELQTSYGQIQRAQNSVTEHLRSLTKVQQEQDQFLQRVGLLEARDRAIERAIEVNESVMDVLDAGMSIEETLSTLERNLRSRRNTTTASGEENSHEN
jgi:flagellar biosynthesis chaperone FliJ